jgi:hypothetical protein
MRIIPKPMAELVGRDPESRRSGLMLAKAPLHGHNVRWKFPISCRNHRQMTSADELNPPRILTYNAALFQQFSNSQAHNQRCSNARAVQTIPLGPSRRIRSSKSPRVVAVTASRPILPIYLIYPWPLLHRDAPISVRHSAARPSRKPGR